MKIIIPDNLGSDIPDIEGVAKAMLERVMLGKSKSGQPKATFRYVITEPMEGYGDSVVGQSVLETFSLQPQAIFRLNKTWREVTGENLPQGDYDPEEFELLLNERLAGTEWHLVLEKEVPSDGSSTESRTVVSSKELVR